MNDDKKQKAFDAQAACKDAAKGIFEAGGEDVAIGSCLELAGHGYKQGCDYCVLLILAGKATHNNYQDAMELYKSSSKKQTTSFPSDMEDNNVSALIGKLHTLIIILLAHWLLLLTTLSFLSCYYVCN